MSVSEQEIAQATRLLENVVSTNTAEETVQLVAAVLRPEGSVLIGGTCRTCVFVRTPRVPRVGTVEERPWCNNADSPTYCVDVAPDFGCVHYQRATSR